MQPGIRFAFRCVPILIKAAKERRTLTYGDLADAIGYKARFMGQPLAYVRDRLCNEHHLPQLTALVVDAQSGLPGDHFFPDGRESLTDEEYGALVHDLQVAVFDYPRWDETWLNLRRHYGYDDK